jgi:hypothetical protein
VFAHNADDVLSMAGILAALASLLEGDNLTPEDAVAVARWCERIGDEARARALYGQSLPLLEGEADWAWASSRYARLCRRAGDRDGAAKLWSRLWDEGDRLAGLELAKHLEHRRRDFAGAESICLRLLDGAPAAEVSALARRIARVRRKRGVRAE